MSRFVIQDKTVQHAFDVLTQSVEAGAIARAMRERREDEKKEAKARAFLKATGTRDEREAMSLLDEGYKAACEAFYVALQADDEWRANRSRSEAIIQAWQTSSANSRAIARIV
jgi:hypothetical protein